MYPVKEPPGCGSLAMSALARPGECCTPVNRRRQHDGILAELVDQHHGDEVPGSAPQQRFLTAVVKGKPEFPQALAAEVHAGVGVTRGGRRLRRAPSLCGV